MQLGVKNFHIARVIKDGDKRTYGTPVMAAKTIKIDLNTEVTEAVLYSHDEVIYQEKEFKKGKISFNPSDLPPELIKMIFTCEEDAEHVLYTGKEYEEDPPLFAIGFQSTKGGGKNKYVWILEVTFHALNESYETMKDGITILTPTIEGEFTKRPDGRWKADYSGLPTDVISAGWFDEVRVFISTETQHVIDLSNINGLILTGVWDSAAGKLKC